MLDATQEEEQHVVDYMASQDADDPVTFMQKVYSERVGPVMHDVWDVHTPTGRWWVVTNPTNLYSQAQFPEMDYVLTFHIGLCIRVPRRERESVSGYDYEPFQACLRSCDETTRALEQAEEVQDFQAIGMRCREMLIDLGRAASSVVTFAPGEDPPKVADFRAWSTRIADALAPGPSNEKRRGLLKGFAESTWPFVQWLTHSRRANQRDAEAAFGCTVRVIELFMTAWMSFVRGVPDVCPECGSAKLAPEHARDEARANVRYERPRCGSCGWTGQETEMKVTKVDVERPRSAKKCLISGVPLTGPRPPKPTLVRSPRSSRDRE
jgi:hypothetical protein